MIKKYSTFRNHKVKITTFFFIIFVFIFSLIFSLSIIFSQQSIYLKELIGSVVSGVNADEINLSRGPYLQPTDDMETSVGIAWDTYENETTTIYYGLNDVGYTELIFNNKVLNASSYAYGKENYIRLTEDNYVINKNNFSENPTPLISDVNIKEVNAYRAVIEWNTDIDAKGQIEFGTSSGNYSWVDMREDQNQEFNTTHSLVLQALNPGKTYYFRVKSWRAGKESVSSEYSFTTNSEAQLGELVAEFDFGGIYMFSDGVRHPRAS